LTDGPAPGGWPDGLRRLLEEHGKKAAGAVVGLLFLPIMQLVDMPRGTVSAQPLPVLIGTALLAAIGLLVLWKSLAGGPPRVGPGFWAGLLVYLAAFGVAAGSDLLVWKRELMGLDARDLPRQWLAPAGLGDWRYHVAARPEPDYRLVIITMDPPEHRGRGEARYELGQLLAAAAVAGARGVALDFAFDTVMSAHDDALCEAFDSLRAAGAALVVGQDIYTIEDRHRPVPDPPSLAGCLGGVRRGHFLGYREPGWVIRHVPLRLAEPHGMEALSLAIAREMEPDSTAGAWLAQGPMLRFVEPAGAPPAVAFSRLIELASDYQNEVYALLRGSFLLIGERSDAETFKTAFGPRLGVEIHAAATQTLLAGPSLRPAPPWLGLLLILVGCYVLVAQALAGAGGGRLVLVAAAVHAGAFAVALLLARAGVWLEVVYAAAAVWGLLPVLAIQRRKHPARLSAPEPAVAPAEMETHRAGMVNR
jgi:hypothetical protein